MATLKYKDENGNYQPIVGVNVQNEVVQTIGQSTTAVMSQKAVTDELANEKQGNGIGTCSTSSGTALTVTLSGYNLVQNGIVAVTFENDVPANATLNINGKGAKPIIYKGAAIEANTIKADDTAMFSYDGTNYVLCSSGAGGDTIDINYDTTNNKITKTINGTTSDVVTAAKIVKDGGGVLNISVFTLETNSSPLFTVSNTDAAERYIDHMGGYLFLVKDGNVYAAKLNPSNWSLFADGSTVTDAVKAATECMIHVPNCYYLGNGTTLQFGGMTPIENGHVFASPHWVGAYEMSDGGHSRAGVGSNAGNSMTGYWNLAQAIHQDFGLANYQFHCLINALYQARYGNLNSESFLSNGNERSSASWQYYVNLAHGMADSLGDGTGCVSAVDGANITRYVTKLFGFEDMFGRLWEYRSGIRFYMDGDVRHAVVYDGNVVSNDAEGRDISGVLSSGDGLYIISMELGEYWDMLPKTVGGSSTTYYCDATRARGGGDILVVGGCTMDGSVCGISCAHSFNGWNTAYGDVGGRLAFYGEPEIISGTELLSML